MADGSEPFDNVYTITSDRFAGVDDILAYARIDLSVARIHVAGTTVAKIVTSGRKTLCNGRPGFFYEMRFPGLAAYEETVVMTLGKKKVYEAIDIRSLSVRADPETLKSILSLCPPE